MESFTRRVGKNLHLDVARAKNGLFDKHPRITEGALRFAHCRLECVAYLVVRFDAPHSASATTRNGFCKTGYPIAPA